MNAYTFTVRVTHTDRTRLPDGGYRTFVALVDVLADTDHEATCVAAQLVHSIRFDSDPMVLGTEIVAVVI